MHVGVLYHRDIRLAHVLLELLRAETDLIVGDNQPYAITDTSDYGVPVHAEPRGLLHVEVEIRQDLIADDAGFNDPKYIKEMGSQVEGLISRTSFAAGKPGSVAAIFDALYKKKTNGDGLEDVSGRGLQGMLVLLDAINRAGSTDAAKIQAALKATDLKVEQMAAGYRGVKFDDKGQNVLATSLITQMRGGQYLAIWPKARATADVILPYKGW